jgi:hypothetical protein
VRGHCAYYAVPGNNKAIRAFRDQVTRNWHRAVRRRSQRTRLNWNAWTALLSGGCLKHGQRSLPATVRILWEPWVRFPQATRRVKVAYRMYQNRAVVGLVFTGG